MAHVQNMPSPPKSFRANRPWLLQWFSALWPIIRANQPGEVQIHFGHQPDTARADVLHIEQVAASPLELHVEGPRAARWPVAFMAGAYGLAALRASHGARDGDQRSGFNGKGTAEDVQSESGILGAHRPGVAGYHDRKLRLVPDGDKVALAAG